MAISKEDLKEVMAEVFNDRRISYEDHSEHHEWIQERIEAEKARKEMYREITKVTIQYSIPVMLAAAYYWLQGHFK
jgi:hypothetical protein